MSIRITRCLWLLPLCSHGTSVSPQVVLEAPGAVLGHLHQPVRVCLVCSQADTHTRKRLDTFIVIWHTVTSRIYNFFILIKQTNRQLQQQKQLVLHKDNLRSAGLGCLSHPQTSLAPPVFPRQLPVTH